MKKVFKIIAYLSVFVALLIGVVFYFTKDLTEIADLFLINVKEKNIDAAYGLCSDEFKAQVSKESFESFIDTLRLGNFKEISWASREINLNGGKLEGVIVRESGERLPISIDFIKAGDKWKIQYIHGAPAGVSSEQINLEVPSEEETVRLVNKSVEVFVQSVREQSMASFYGHIAELFRAQTNVQKLDDAFKPFFGLDNILDSLKSSTPVFTEKPSLDENGAYVVRGYYPIVDQRFNFDLKYIREGMSWKIISFSVKIK